MLWDCWIDRSKNPRSDWPSMDDDQDKGLASLRCKTWGVWSQELSANLEIISGYDVVLFGFISN